MSKHSATEGSPRFKYFIGGMDVAVDVRKFIAFSPKKEQSSSTKLI